MEDTQGLAAQSAPDVFDFDTAFENARQAMLKAGVLEEIKAEGETDAVESDDELTADETTPHDEDDEQTADDESDDDDSDEPDLDEDDDDTDVVAGDEDDDSDAATERVDNTSDDGDGSTDPQARPKRKRGNRGKKIQRLEDQNGELKTQLETLERTLIERFRTEQRAEAERTERERAQAVEDQRLQQEVDEILGDKDTYNEKLRAALNGDYEAAEWVKETDQTREKFTKIQARAERVVKERAGQVFIEATKDLPGLDQSLLMNGSLYNVVRHIYYGALELGRGESGQSLTKSQQESQKKIDTLTRKNERLQAQLDAARPRRATQMAKTPISGGNPITEKTRSKLEGLMDPVTGFPTDEAEMLIRTGRLKLLEAS